jgi:hypothetical protein
VKRHGKHGRILTALIHYERVSTSFCSHSV